ncbi:hypothetical protein PV10_05253 [Exophiala mesophila]|uniref:Zn(2)-C6 fungal-type domain-containing protein n=1 Tax=Exophiala mesophila TaxID=212818 RepID=A0A0D2A529_EXOME|nr:uncharacterized protein PV10_05253 [Exophiala mesophila]KIV94098.1 hypothetical protein PV10_05253 [Exophiala mesophila]
MVHSQSSDNVTDWDENLGTLFGPRTSSEQGNLGHNGSSTSPLVVDIGGIVGNNDPKGENIVEPTNLMEQSRLGSSGVKPLARSRPRRQNHSCDPCRIAKRACDLYEHNVTIRNGKPDASCSTCEVRGLDCTASWLASRQSTQQVKKLARMSCAPSEKDRSSTQSSVDEAPLAVEEWFASSGPEQELVRQFTGSAATAHQLNIYIDAIDVPLADQLSGGCMPPQFPLGLAVLPRLHGHSKLSPYIYQAQTWVKHCWNTPTSAWSFPGPAPHLFFPVSVLDSMFEQSTNPEHSPRAAARSAMYNEIYKWVALATASQFSVYGDGNGKQLSQDLASATWHKAKNILFQNISATGSFRQALSLILFGTICPPPTKGDSSALQADADFAHVEGVRRLQSLCAQAAAYLQSGAQVPRWKRRKGMAKPVEQPHPVHSLAPEVKDDLLELVGALEWLLVTLNSVAIVISQGTLCAIPPEQCAGDKSCLHLPRGHSSETAEATSTVALRHEESLNDSIVARAQTQEQPVTTLVHGDTTVETMRHVISKSGSLVIPIYKSLASLTMAIQNMQEDESSYDDIHKHLLTVFALVEVWRTTFGKFDGSTTLRVQSSASNVRSLMFSLVGDGDLAVLLLYKLLCRLDDDIREHKSSPAHDLLAATIRSMWTSFRDHRVESAIQVSNLASTVIKGTKTHKTYMPGIACHPYPALVVQAHTLAAEAFTDEIQVCIMNVDTQRAAEMASGLNLCLQGLDGLKCSLSNVPSVNSHDEQTDSWHLRYST